MSRKGPLLIAVAALAVIAAIVMAMFSAHHNATASIPTPPSQGDTKVNSKDGLSYVWIPAGTLQMGCSPNDTECESDERPAHTVTITYGFWITGAARQGELTGDGSASPIQRSERRGQSSPCLPGMLPVENY